MIYRGVTSMVGFAAKQPEAPVVLTGILLDDYPGALAAFSLRKLRAAYGGAALRMRNNNGDGEADIGFDVNGDFDTAAAAAHLASPAGSGFITTWYDQSGNGNDVTQATAGNQPRYVPTGFSIPLSLPSIRTYAAEPQYLMRTNVATAGSNVVSGFGVARPGGGTYMGLAVLAEMSQTNDYDNDFSIVLLGANSDASALMTTLSGTSSGTVAFAGGGVPFRTAAFKQASGTFWITQNGIAGTTASDTLDLGGPTNDLCRLLIASRWSAGGASNYWDGSDYVEVVIYLADRSSWLSGIDANQEAGWGF